MTLMVFSFKKQIAALAVSALALAPVATGVTLLSAEAAFAKPGGSGGGGGGGRDRSSSGRSDRGDRDNENRGAGRSNDNNRSGNSSSSRTTQTQTQTTTTQQAPAQSNGNAYGQRTADEDRPGQGAIRSELKGMNAIHSFKDGAFPDAAPGSQVGRLATYFETAGLTSVALEDYDAALAAVTTFEAKNDGFVENTEAQQNLTDALMDFDDKYSTDGTSLGIDSIEGAYSFINEAYGTTENPIDTFDKADAAIQLEIDRLTQEQEDAPLEAPVDNLAQIESLNALKTELANLEGLGAAIDPLQVEYAALNETLTVEQCEYQNALDGEGDAFLDASNGRDIDEFSDTTITYLRDTLGLGETYSSPENPVDPVDCSST
jgi:hypothetical protein